MRNDNRNGMKYDTKKCVLEIISGNIFINAASYARHIGVTKQAVYKALKSGSGKIKGNRIRYADPAEGFFFYEEEFEKMRAKGY